MHVFSDVMFLSASINVITKNTITLEPFFVSYFIIIVLLFSIISVIKVTRPRFLSWCVYKPFDVKIAVALHEKRSWMAEFAVLRDFCMLVLLSVCDTFFCCSKVWTKKVFIGSLAGESKLTN